ncbi:hypothetical protein Dda_0305 [Drechslerella dactyloides]|uniref:Uncharacterized protein n=1 Tax=Drechslerella dactyloides TaxID=74499 RepID=A0AAD6J422_DREDA|nr:hypothetical protein Dda_0305 [Drechslerella dactyloides]
MADKNTYVANGQFMQRYTSPFHVITTAHANVWFESSPPLTSRITRFTESAIQFIGLYTVSLLSVRSPQPSLTTYILYTNTANAKQFDPYASAEASSFATQNNAAMQGTSRGNGSTGFGGSSRQDPRGGNGGGSGGGSGGGGRRLGTIDQVRGPECGSCG